MFGILLFTAILGGVGGALLILRMMKGRDW